MSNPSDVSVFIRGVCTVHVLTVTLCCVADINISTVN